MRRLYQYKPFAAALVLATMVAIASRAPAADDDKRPARHTSVDKLFTLKVLPLFK
ncbi:MAG TPA: hypothetical protein QF564_13125 [Pirellulaceae bacterium]|nr:hypothetical protein [Pirellulaceae bacterium]